MKTRVGGVTVLIVAVVAVLVWNLIPRASRPASIDLHRGIHEDIGGSPPTTPTAVVRSSGQVARSGSAPVLPTARPTILAISPAGSERPRYVVIITLDGGRPDYLKVHGIPHIRALERSGTSFSSAFAGILESETPAGHATIATGSNPNRDGILAFSWANSQKVVTDIFDPAKILDHTMENIVASTHVPTIAGLLKRAHPSARVVAISGNKYYAADAFGGPDADVIMWYHNDSHGHYAPIAVPGHEPPPSILQDPTLTLNTTRLPPGTEDHLGMALAARTFETMHQQVTLINEPEFDWPLGHVDGAMDDPQAVTALMQGFDRDLGLLEDAYRRAGVLDQTLFVLTADHGFAPIRHIVPESDILNAMTAAGTTAVEDNFTTADYLWLNDTSKANQVASNIAHLLNPHIQSVYFKSLGPGGATYIRASGPELFHVPGVESANQYLLNTFNGPNGPDVVIFFTQDTSSLSSAQASWKGNHGGGDWESQHIPLIISGPGVRSGYVTAEPARLEDLAPTALTLMGVAPAGMEGTPLADAMSHPSAALMAQRSGVIRTLVPVVQALRAESAAELASGN